MPFIDTSKLKVIERKPGWFGRYSHSPSMTFAHYEFKKGSTVHKHLHEQEEVWTVIEGELEITIARKKKRAKPGTAGIVPSNTPHSVKGGGSDSERVHSGTPFGVHIHMIDPGVCASLRPPATFLHPSGVTRPIHLCKVHEPRAEHVPG